MKHSLDALLTGKSRQWVLSSDLTPFGVAVDRCLNGELGRAVRDSGDPETGILVPVTKPGWVIQVLLLPKKSCAQDIEKKIKNLCWQGVASAPGEFDQWRAPE